MSAQPRPGVAEVLETVQALKEGIADIKTEQKNQRNEIAEFKERHKAPQYVDGANPAAFYRSVPRSSGVSGGYSYLKMAAYCAGVIGRDEAKYELDIAEKLDNIYATKGLKKAVGRSLMAPYWSANIPYASSAEERTVTELREKAIADRELTIDQDETAWLHKRFNYREKDLSTLVDTQGGVLIGFPTLMELVDIQRNIEVFSRAGATEQPLPANGRMQYPKLTNVTTAFWVGEGTAITESTPATGYLDLQAKKLGILVDFNNEMLRFSSIAAEGMVRGDMAKVAALKADLAMLEGTGGTQIKGLITYDSASSWTTGQDKLITFTVTGNKLNVSDGATMESKLPDTAGEPTAWIMRRDMWAFLRNRRAGASTATDEGGPYLASIIRDLQEKQRLMWDGTPVVRSSQVSNTRGGGSQTYVILGYFPDWIVARFGALEFLASNVSDNALVNDQTRLRCIQHIDAGARHASSFVFADAINVS